MKKYLFLFAAFTAINMAQPVQAQQAASHYGKSFNKDAAKTPEELVKALDGKTTVQNIAVKGEIAQVCQAEGCWIKIKNPAGENIFVKFKEHSFVVPKDIAGKNAVVYGTASKKTVSIAERKHMAEDAGASKAEIDAITTTQDQLRIDATGVEVN